MSSVPDQQPKHSHPWYYYIFTGFDRMFVLVGLVIFYFSVTMPKRAEEAWRAKIETQQSELGIAQGQFALTQGKRLSDLERRRVDANVVQAEHVAKQISTPVVQLSPKLSQSISVEDIREIRLRVLLDNLSEAEAKIKR